VSRTSARGAAPRSTRSPIYTAAVTASLAEGGCGFGTFTEGRDPRVTGNVQEALVSYFEDAAQPVPAPEPVRERRISEASSSNA
jgi:hypothetical protein